MYCLLRARAARARPALSLASLFLLTAFLVVLAVQPALSDTLKIEILDWQNTVVKTISNIACSCSCPSGTGAYKQRECACSYDLGKFCASPGQVKARATWTNHGTNCDGKAAHGNSISNIQDVYVCDDVAYAKVYHSTAGLIDTTAKEACSCSCPEGTGAEAKRKCECSISYDSSGCKVPGQYKIETFVDHAQNECGGRPSSKVSSNLGKVNAFTCNIIDKGTYYVYPPGVTGPKTSGYVHKKDVDCPASCPSDKVYTSTCPSHTVPQASICTDRSGYYTVNTRIQHKGHSCSTGKALYKTTSWSDNTNLKAFSCA
ncbi:MAG: hypothetical protein QGG50_08720, partial [Methanopyri archaeon]|nr:hypothetical protein [Methanopyri archaeon]